MRWVADTENNQYFLSENSPLILITLEAEPSSSCSFWDVANEAPSAWKEPLDGAPESSARAVLLLTLQPPQPGLLDVSKCNLAAAKLGYKCLGRDYLQLPEHFF